VPDLARWLDPARLPPRPRDVAAAVVQGAWGWATTLGMIAPHDGRGRRFHSMGPGSALCFPQGSIFGERWIAIGAGTLVAPHASLSAGMWPDEPLQPAAPDGVVLRIGERCTIGRATALVARVGLEVGDDVTIGPNAYLTDHNHTYADPHRPIAHQWPSEAPTVVGSGSWIGAGAVVLAGSTLGRNVVVAAGAVVRGEVPDHAVVAGAPAKVVRRWTEGAGWDPPLPPAVLRPPPDWEAGLPS
jgi:carbonic anhydrase/acetyltransferase-like protein (isoleucine patch superfamily)